MLRGRRHLDGGGHEEVTLFITGGFGMPEDFGKALRMGADGIAIANSAIQAIGCVAARMCNTNNCPSGIATQKPGLRHRLKVDEAVSRLARFPLSLNDLIKVLARACGHHHVRELNPDDLSTWQKEMAELSGVTFSGVG